MKINILNKSITMGVALCFAALSFTSAQAIDIIQDNGYDATYNGSVYPDGGTIKVGSRSSITFNNATLGTQNGFEFSVTVENGYYTAMSGASIVSLNDSFLAASIISVSGTTGIGTYQSLFNATNSNISISGYLSLENNSVFRLTNSTVTALGSGFHSYDGSTMELNSSHLIGYINGGMGHSGMNLEAKTGASSWTSIGSSWVDSIYVDNYYSGASLNVNLVMKNMYTALNIGNTNGPIDYSINFTDEFLESIMAGEGAFTFHVLDTIVCSNVTNPDDISVHTSNGTYQWDLVDFADGYWKIENISLIPEPSTYAAIFGVFALALAIYRRRK